MSPLDSSCLISFHSINHLEGTCLAKQGLSDSLLTNQQRRYSHSSDSYRRALLEEECYSRAIPYRYKDSVVPFTCEPPKTSGSCMCLHQSG